jgi:hypothetical protein
MVDSIEKDLLIKNYKFNCRCCGGINLKRVISLGYQPLANNLLNKAEDKCDVYPLELNWCSDCFNCQLSYVVEPEKLFSHYLYLSSTTTSFVSHFKEAAKSYINEFNLDKKFSKIIDIGSNDGIALKPFKDLGFSNILGIESAKNLVEIANNSGIMMRPIWVSMNELKPFRDSPSMELTNVKLLSQRIVNIPSSPSLVLRAK